MSESLLIYGVTGYTGALIARRAASAGLSPVVAARNAAAVEMFAAALGARARSFGLDEADSLDPLLADVTVVLNAAGPFERTALQLARACIRTGTHYLDIAGEVPEFERLRRLDPEARAAGVMLLPGVGFGVVPTDCLAAHLAARLPDAVRLQLAYATEGSVSRGTLSMVLRDLHRIGAVRRGGELEPEPPAQRTLRIRVGDELVPVISNPWRADLSSAFLTTGIPNIETYSAFPPPLAWLMRRGESLGRLWSSAAIQSLLGAVVRRLPDGPSDAQREAGSTLCWGRVEDAGGHAVAGALRGPEAYEFTARCAVACARAVLGGSAPPGFQTPALAFGADFALGPAGTPWLELDAVR